MPQLATVNLKAQGTQPCRLLGVILQNIVTLHGTDKLYIPPRFKALHQSWVPELDYPGHLYKDEMENNHGGEHQYFLRS